MNICLLPPTHPGPDPVGSLKSEGITLLQIKNRSLFLPRVCSMFSSVYLIVNFEVLKYRGYMLIEKCNHL